MLPAAAVERYSRQMLLPQVGPDAQKRILKGSVLVIGAGGLGCPVVLYLAGAGVGRLGIVDHDVVDVSNLHRQIAHTTDRKGMNKAESARVAALAINPTIVVEAHTIQFTSASALDLVSSYDVVVDATDNPGTRYLISDACVLAGKPLVSGAAIGMSGQLSVYNWEGGPCYRCVFPEPPPRGAFVSCSDGGVLGPVPGLIATQQALECLKLLGPFGSPLSQRHVDTVLVIMGLFIVLLSLSCPAWNGLWGCLIVLEYITVCHTGTSHRVCAQTVDLRR
jgi:adenylyltransferase and sulfurtransferase